MVLNKIFNEFRKIQLKRSWRKKNRNNFTSIGMITSMSYIDFVNNGGITVGKNTYGRLNVNYTGAEGERLVIGANCSIAGSCNFLLGGEHDYTCITTYPYAYRVFHKGNDVKTKGSIIIDDEVWIGDAAWIMSGVHIGKGAIVATGAIVTKNVPPYAIVGGCPASIIKYRFSKDIINKFLMIDLNQLEITEEQLPYLTAYVDENNIDEILMGLGIEL
jgi:acetyltransferase-like isoleucine patch superfamily enzyme